jgi:hypothetical protein
MGLPFGPSPIIVHIHKSSILAKAYEIKVWCNWEHFGEHIEDLIRTFGNLIEKEKRSLPRKFVQHKFSKGILKQPPFFSLSPSGKILPKQHTHTHILIQMSHNFFSEIRGFLSEKMGIFQQNIPLLKI